MAERRIAPADLTQARTTPLVRRTHKVSVAQAARVVGPEATVGEFLGGLADVLAVGQLRGLAEAIVAARAKQRPVLWALGGHIVKTGVTPYLAHLIERGYIQGLVVNGAFAIHDWEIAAVGATSEDVDRSLPDGSFGMADETGRAFAEAAARAQAGGLGLGEVLGPTILAQALPFAEQSLLAAAARNDVPVTVHVAVGCDIVHQHPAARGEAIGAASHLDFRRLVTLVSELEQGVWVHCGSAVQLPEVFLKALSLARNLGHRVHPLTTANLDMQRHYRTRENVLRRPTLDGGRSFELIGHHEINIPLLAQAILQVAGR